MGRLLNPQTFRDRFTARHGTRLTLLDEYTKMRNPVRAQCTGCGGITERTPLLHLRSSGCSFCESWRRHKARRYAAAKEAERRGLKILVRNLGHCDARASVRARCVKCGVVWSGELSLHARRGCPRCGP